MHKQLEVVYYQNEVLLILKHYGFCLQRLKPSFPAEIYTFQSLFGIVYFQQCLN